MKKSLVEVEWNTTRFKDIMRTIHISGLPSTVDEGDVEMFCGYKFGPVEWLEFHEDRRTAVVCSKSPIGNTMAIIIIQIYHLLAQPPFMLHVFSHHTHFHLLPLM